MFPDSPSDTPAVSQISRLLGQLAAGLLPLSLITLGLGLAAFMVPDIAVWLLPVAAPLAVVLILVAGLRLRQASRARSRARDLSALFSADPDAVWLTDSQGRTIGGNPAAVAAADRLEQALASWSATPAALIGDLRRQALRFGQAERLLSRPNAGLVVRVHGVDAPGGESDLLWRLSRSGHDRSREVDSLALPLVSLDVAGQGIRVNAALRALLGVSDADSDTDTATVLSPIAAPLAPLLSGQATLAQITLPSGTSVQAIALPPHDGQREIVLLPPWLRHDPVNGVRDFEDIPVALALIGPDGRILDSNHLARALLGIGPDEDRYLWQVLEGLGRPIADWLADGRAGRALNRPEVVRAILPRTESFVQVILRRPPGAPPGPVETMVAVLSDATELKSLETRFVQSQKMQAIGQLAGGVAHDFNNLLTAISGHCDLLLLERDGFDPDFSDLQQIRQNTNRAAALVRQLLAFSRKQTLKPEVVTLESLLENLAHLLTRLVGERIGLQLSHDPDLAPVRADPRQLEQVILNLVVNARDAMPMGGTIRIETESLDLAADMERGRARVPAGRYAVIRVIDAGLGIPAEILDKVFEPFFTTKRPGEGTGLGLSTAYGIMKQMGGWIFADSREGSGSTFTLYFSALDPAQAGVPASSQPALTATAPLSGDAAPAPQGDADTPPPAIQDATDQDAVSPAPASAAARTAAPPTTPPAAPPATAAAARLEGTIVLLVEDEAPVRMFAARALRLQGCHVLEAESGEQALDFLRDPGLRVDLFLTDVVMPGIDGPGWVVRALATRPQTPVIFMSGYAEDALSAALARVPRSAFLGKPFALRDLTEAVAAQTRRTTPVSV